MSSIFRLYKASSLKDMKIERHEELKEELDLLKIFKKKQLRIEKQIEGCIRKDDWLNKTVDLIDSLPGFAKTLSFVCATELGPISRFKSRNALAADAGMHPCVDSSAGKIKHGRIRRVGRKLFRWALIEAAHAASRTNNPVAKYYKKKAKQKKSNHAAAIATANKLAKLMYHILSKECLYNPGLEQ
ncbi:IS110 family transposase [Candidatus Woesearchaeota archaeon]|nr:IS110 family transposase [Candidatus Woesearchaeota archaeon]